MIRPDAWALLATTVEWWLTQSSRSLAPEPTPRSRFRLHPLREGVVHQEPILPDPISRDW